MFGMVRRVRDDSGYRTGMRSREAWLDAGLEALATSGPPGLRLEILCRAMGATRGSFYHHFEDITAFRRGVMERFEQRRTDAFIEVAEAVQGLGAAAQVDALEEAVFGALSPEELDLERGFRAWATAEPDVAAALARVDERRLGFLGDLLRQVGLPGDPDDRAMTIYLLIMGGVNLNPPLPPERIRRLVDQQLGRG